MLQILLWILKILGILILVILGLILTVLLLVLFVPLRYRIDANFDGKPHGNVLVSWLLHLVTVRVSYDGSVKALVKVLWFRLFDQTVWSPGEKDEESEDLAFELDDEEFIDLIDRSVESEPVVTPAVPEPPERPVVTAEQEEMVQTAEVHPAEVHPVVETAESERESEADAQKTGDSNSEPKKPLIDRIFEKMVSVLGIVKEKIRTTYATLTGKVQDGKQKMQGIRQKIDWVRAFLNDEENRATIALIFRQIKKLLVHLLPRRIHGRLRFGFDDPAKTGQVLVYISPFYGLYAKTLVLEPVFDEEVIEGELHIKGHIRVASLIWIALRVLLNKNFRTQLKAFRRKRK